MAGMEYKIFANTFEILEGSDIVGNGFEVQPPLRESVANNICTILDSMCKDHIFNMTLTRIDGEGVAFVAEQALQGNIEYGALALKKLIDPTGRHTVSVEFADESTK